MAPVEHEVIAGLLLLIFCFALVMTMLLVYFVLRWRYRKALLASEEPGDWSSVSPKSAHRPPSFALKRPGNWLAVKTRNHLAVQSALTLQHPKPCSLAEGLSGGEEHRLFISPPVSGWILVIGPALPDPNDDVDACFRFLLDLSRKLGHVQFFSANTMFNHHAWARVEAGQVIRAYAWAGKTLWNQGERTLAERDLKMKCYRYAEAAEPNPFTSSEPVLNNADKVHLLAARWSLDPDEIDDQFSAQEWGIVGEPSRPL